MEFVAKIVNFPEHTLLRQYTDKKITQHINSLETDCFS